MVAVAVLAAALAAAIVRLWNIPKEQLARRRDFFLDGMTLAEMRTVQGSLLATPEKSPSVSISSDSSTTP